MSLRPRRLFPGGGMTNSRNKGASFEREVARELELLTGVKFKRDLDQYRQSERGDLITDQPWPFAIECKRRASGSFDQKWWQQAVTASMNVTLPGVSFAYPVVIYRFDRKPIQVRISSRTILECVTRKKWSAEDYPCDIDLNGLAYLYREWVAG